jgi:hypothetical protein
MKLLFTKPHETSGYPSFWMGAALKGYLQYHNVFIGKEMVDFTISYNKCYNFYDISLFEIEKNGQPSKHIDDSISVLQNDGNKIEVMTTLRWEDKKRINGKRIWINI